MQSITFTVKYSSELASVVGTDFDKFTVDLGTGKGVIVPFNFAMYSVESIHPKLFEKYPPGKLDFKLNNQDPKPTTPLKDGDEVWFGVLFNKK